MKETSATPEEIALGMKIVALRSTLMRATIKAGLSLHGDHQDVLPIAVGVFEKIINELLPIEMREIYIERTMNRMKDNVAKEKLRQKLMSAEPLGTA